MREQNFHQAPDASISAKAGSLVDPPLDSLHTEDDQDAFVDPTLDSLLARIQAPELRAGFAERVIHSVQPASIQTWKQASKSFPLRALGLAAALVLGTGALLWTNIGTNIGTHIGPNNSQKTSQTAFPQSASPEEEHLIAVLRSPEFSGDDLALVANLREVLEAELIANHPLWLDEK